jgi:hypothetical protein
MNLFKKWWWIPVLILVGLFGWWFGTRTCGPGGPCPANPADANTAVPNHTYAPDGLSLINNAGLYCTGAQSTICRATNKDKACPYPNQGLCKDTYNTSTGVCACKCLNNPPIP